MGWVIVFIVNWILFILLVDKKRIWPGLIGGLFAILMQIIVDNIALGLDLYRIHDYILCLFHAGSIFFTFGPVFVVGILFVQNIPSNRWMRLANIFIWVVLFMLLEFLMKSFGYLEYIKWSPIWSMFVDITVIVNLSWVGENFVAERE